MKSKIKFIIIIAVVAVILAGVVLALNLTAPEEEVVEETTEVEVTTALLYDKNPEDINLLTITNSYGTYTVQRYGEDGNYVWTVPEYAAAPVSGSAITSLVEKAATLTSQQVAMENAEDISIYGLTEPQAEYKVEFDDSAKTVKEVVIGSAVPGSSNVYMCFKGENKVYTVRSSDVLNFTYDKRNCINKTVYTAYTSTDTTDTTDYTRIDKITIQRKDIDYDIVIEYDTRLDIEGAIVSNSSSHRLTSPVVLDLNPDKSAEITGNVFGLAADDFAVLNPTDEDKTEYGFDDPFADISMDIVGGDFHMTLGNEYLDENGKQAGYYAIIEGIDVIYIFKNSNLPWLNFLPLDITTTMITSNYIYGVTSMDIVIADSEDNFTMSGSSDDDFAVKLNGADIDKDAFKSLYQFILRAPAEQLCFDDPSGEPKLALTINSETGTDVIEFYPIENRRTVIRLNGVTSFTCKTAYLDRLVENIEKFKNGEELITNW